MKRGGREGRKGRRAGRKGEWREKALRKRDEEIGYPGKQKVEKRERDRQTKREADRDKEEDGIDRVSSVR